MKLIYPNGVNHQEHIPESFTLPDVSWKLLPNNLKVICLKDDSNPVLCLQLYIRTGSVKENPRQRGYSHYLEHLCFKSTNLFPNNRLSHFASNLGGMINAFTDYDCTCYYLLLPAEELDNGLLILSQLAIHTTFNPKDVEFEKDIILEEIKQYDNEPEANFLEYIQCHHFIDSPLKHPILGNVTSINKADHKALKSFYLKNYIPDNTFLVVCGDFDDEMLIESVEHHFADWKSKQITPQAYPIEPELPPAQYKFRKHTKGEEFLAIVLPELCEAHPLSDAMLIAIRYLAIGKSSRLFKRLVEEDKLCSSVKVNSLGGILSGASVIMICPMGRKHIPEILNVFKEEYHALLQHDIPNDELHLVKQDIIHNWLYSFEGVENTANLIAAEEFIGNINGIHTYGERIQNISMEEIRSAMAKYWQPNLISIYYEGLRPFEGFSEIHFGKTVPSMPSLRTKPIIKYAIESHNESTCSTKFSSIEQLNDHHFLINLSNGMTVLFKQLQTKSISGFSLSSKISPLCEAPDQRGLNFFTSSLMLYGTRKHTHEELMQISREHGFNIKVIHHLDTTTYRGKCQSLQLEHALTMLAEIFYTPRFDKEHLEMLLTSALDSIRRDNDYPVSYAYQRWFKMLVGAQSNLYRSTGNPSDIRTIRLKNINEWHEKWNSASDFCLAIVGRHTPIEVAEMCESLFGIVKASKSVFSPLAYYQSVDNRLVKQYRKTDQAIIHLGGFATPALNREANAAFHVLAQILGGDLSSRFFDILREQHGFAYQTGFDFSSINELGFWNAYAFCDHNDYRKCRDMMQSILNDIQQNGIKEDELSTAINYLIGMNRFDYESVSYTASSMSNLAALGYEPQFYFNREARLKAVTKDSIDRVASQWLSTDNHFLHIMV